MSEEQASNSLTTVAQEVYGENYHDSHKTPKHGLTLDAAYEKLQESKDLANDEAESLELEADSRPVSETTQADDSDDSPDDGALWTNEDLQTISLLKQEYHQLQEDMQKFAQAKQTNLNELEKTDKAKASALRTQMQEAEKELRQRYDALNETATELEAKANAKYRKQAEKYLQKEKAKLEKAMPNIDGKAWSQYLMDYGFTENDIRQIYDHRHVVLVEKARLYDELMARKPKTTARVKTDKTKESPRQDNIAALEQRLKNTGRVDDAYNLLQAKKQQRAS